MESRDFNQGLLSFIADSPTPFHAVESIEHELTQSGFELLDEAESWELRAGGKYVVKRGGSIIAFKNGQGSNLENGIHLTGAHTDSPCLKIKPVAEVRSKGYLQLGLEVYGGALLNPWFDRDLSIAGQVTFQSNDEKLCSCLINLKDPVAVIPSLAIHLDREANSKKSIDAQKHLPAVLLQLDENDKFDFEGFLLDHLQQALGITEASSILSYELCLYDTQPPAIVGLNQQFIAAARLDNLLSCYLITQSLISSNGDYTSLLVCNDHEEVGSASASGAQGPFLRSVLNRIISVESTDQDALERVYRKSLLISIDNAHAVHPNYGDRHDPEHGPMLNQGPVIKINANQRYASNSETIARFRSYCNKVDVPTQSFVMRSNMACGSTIGPITATETGINTVDVGVPTFAMHSIRELAGTTDAEQLSRVVTAFYNR
jgi:aspartyl aminopeptidase